MTRNKTIIKCIRIKEKDNEMISYLNSVKIRWTDIVYPEIHRLLKIKCEEMKIKKTKDYCPF